MRHVIEMTTINPPRTERFDEGVCPETPEVEGCLVVKINVAGVVEFHMYPLSNVSKCVSLSFPEAK